MMKKVTREEYIHFVNSYPRPLTADVCGISEPPLESFSDFASATGADVIVARHHRETDNYWIACQPPSPLGT